MSSPVPDAAASAPDAPSNPGRGRGGGRGGRGGRGNGGRNHKGQGQAKKAKFRGASTAMGGHVFELPEEANDRTQYSKTMTKLQAVAKENYKDTYMQMSALFADPMNQPVVERPAPLPEGAPADDITIRNEELKIFAKTRRELQANLVAFHNLIWEQTSPAMQTKVKSVEGFEERFDAHDCVWLLQQLKAVTMNYDNKKNPMVSEIEAKKNFFACQQAANETPEDFMNRLKAWADVVKHCGGNLSGNWTNVPESLGDEDARAQGALEYTLATVFIQGLDKTRYGTFIGELKNDYVKGNDHYPTDLATAFALVNLYEVPKNAPAQQQHRAAHLTREQGPKAEATTVGNFTFTQAQTSDGVVTGNDGRVFPDVLCYNCNLYGHYAGNCTLPNNRGTTLLQHAYVLTQASRNCDHCISNEWILLDTQSTVSVFNNPQYLYNIRKSDEVLRAVTNGGYQDSYMVGEFPNLGTVWFNPESIANILSMKDVNKVCRVTLDTEEELALLVHRKDVTTVEANKKLFTTRQVQQADEARRLYRIVGRPGMRAFEAWLRKNRVHNCPVTVDDARRAIAIYGPDIPHLKGTTTAGPPPEHVPTLTAIPVPRSILLHHNHVTLAVDFVFVNKIPFITTISRAIGWRTIAPVPNRQKATMLKEFRRLFEIYKSRGLPVTAIHGDNEFACLRDDIGPVRLDIVAPNTHVPEIERSNRTIKERARTTIHGLPYTRLPIAFVQHLMMNVVHWLNVFPWKYGVSDDLSPETIMTGSPPPDYNKLRIEFGSYAQVFDAPTPSNTPRSRTHGAIALCSTGNHGGAYYFLSLASGEVIVRHQWTLCHIHDSVLTQMDRLAQADNQPLIQTTGLIVEWGDPEQVYLPFPDEVDDPFLLPNTDQGAKFDIQDDIQDTDADQHNDNLQDTDTDLQDQDNDGFQTESQDPDEDFQDQDQADFQDQDQADFQDQDQAVQHDDNLIDDAANETDFTVHNEIDEEEGASDDTEENTNTFVEDQGAPEVLIEGATELLDEHEGAAENEEKEPEADFYTNQGTESRYQLRDRNHIRAPTRLAEAMDEPHSTKAYETPKVLLQTVLVQAVLNTATDQGKMNMKQLQKIIFGRVFAQLTAKAAIKLYGDDAIQALMQEFAQLDDLDVFMAMQAQSLTRQQKKEALRAINLVTKKRDGRIKGRTVADGSVQKNLYEKSQTASPTVSTDSLLLSLIVDAHEGRDVAIADVVGAYLKANMKDFTLLKFTGESVDIMCKMNPKYEAFVAVEGGKRVLYVQLRKALYGCVCSALLWYEMFAGALQDMGFELNPYDTCVANKTINGKQCTIAWYVDDMKVSHVDPNVVTTVIEDIEGRFGKMSVTRGMKHKFLGMDIEFQTNNTVVVQMRDYLQESIDESKLGITQEATTPAKSNLFDIDEASPALEGDEFDVFRSVVAKLLYIAVRARMDILLPVSFLCTRVTKSTKQDQNKLKRVLEYVKGTLELTYTMGADSLNKMRSWVDAAFAVHPDMKSHTGGITSFGRGGLVCKSTKQKLNTRSSTEAELVGASDYLPHTVWVKLFMEAQGHKMTEVIFEQDNESAIRMEKNGRLSAGQKSRHIDISNAGRLLHQAIKWEFVP
ncbi:hypothetical protein FisN_17Lu131 [Fistulifera solaris]|uniref:CCHC-type domain-containing protein n=1 Tax=Fistulifera solaris TaxID=1519565 RepID=A0A1Z5K1V6_FISSO|nr:hypothetical protein FisN_17Lu131 [Fistulifera solaris]|eukprot:GAX20129.1 hypothetical protein FisN_17Lu131 [Fistulifera solaris]